MTRKTKIVGDPPSRDAYERLQRAHARALAKLRGHRPFHGERPPFDCDGGCPVLVIPRSR